MHPVMNWLKSKKKPKKGPSTQPPAPLSKGGKLEGVMGASGKIGKNAAPAAKKKDQKGSGSPSKKVVDKDADDV